MTLREVVLEKAKYMERDGGEYYLCCPFCGDKRYRLGVNVLSGTWNCFNCKEAGRDNPRKLFRLLCEVYEIEGETYEPGDEGERTAAEQGVLRPVQLPAEYEPLWEGGLDTVGKKARQYLIDRRVTEKQIARHMVGFCAVGIYAWRVVFPVMWGGEVVGFVARDITGKSERRYLNSKGLKGVWNARKEDPRKTAVLFEGIFSALVSENALKGVRCLGKLGAGFTDLQMEVMSGYEEVTVWGDSDSAGAKGAIEAAEALEQVGKKVNLIVPEKGDKKGLDAGDLSMKEIARRYEGRRKHSNSLVYLLRSRVAGLSG